MMMLIRSPLALKPTALEVKWGNEKEKSLGSYSVALIPGLAKLVYFFKFRLMFDVKVNIHFSLLLL